ncbi:MULTISPECIES: DUF1573 domain-containing protein [unclassified Flavobacterium]|uniref:DUF1573 domain-containing protein n=1 Tax=unclassified Flavobacterium TaxID=196869 RepID=UPI0036120A60
MKKIILMFAAVAFLGTYTATAQEAPAKAKAKTEKKAKKTKLPKVDGVGLVFENETIDYGTIEQGADGKREFVLTNNGNQPLIISNAQGSCGCTVPTFPKEPILPGKSAVIGVKYDTNRVGPFTKTVTITSNATAGASKVLTIKGTINAKPGETPKS